MLRCDKMRQWAKMRLEALVGPGVAKERAPGVLNGCVFTLRNLGRWKEKVTDNGGSRFGGSRDGFNRAGIDGNEGGGLSRIGGMDGEKSKSGSFLVRLSGRATASEVALLFTPFLIRK